MSLKGKNECVLVKQILELLLLSESYYLFLGYSQVKVTKFNLQKKCNIFFSKVFQIFMKDIICPLFWVIICL